MWKYKRLSSFKEALWMERLQTAEVSHVFFHPILMEAWLKTYELLRQNELIITSYF